MPFISQALSDAKELDVVPEGEYDLRVVSCEVVQVKRGKNEGKDQIRAIIAVESSEYPNARSIYHFMSLADANDDDRSRNGKLISQKRFCHTFNIPFEVNGWNTEDAVGATSRARLTQEVNEESGETSNRMVLPRLAEDDVTETPRKRRRG